MGGCEGGRQQVEGLVRFQGGFLRMIALERWMAGAEGEGVLGVGGGDKGGRQGGFTGGCIDELDNSAIIAVA